MTMPEFAGIGAASGTAIGFLLVACGCPEVAIYPALAVGAVIGAVALPYMGGPSRELAA